ncbi:type IV toxin-antitoxin system AbiEi family antitoxin domain-containing protein [Megasphaera elsdenii]|uniref:type IV toxin-antitoxin system AbiEi family antitoxin domain-containing protein n=1 Tax=Megasphaera elsdenii TaxID=907 RepID=UPI00092113BD|nr:abortive phage infection protein [Megasphaera elsdenii]SHK59159.1 Transcriptional regulator, AbiEi antitoxin, Type IV TA system [Megasphaera elsdenii]
MKQTSDFIDTSGMLLTKNAIQGGIKKDEFYRFIAANHFEKAAHGIYLSPEAWEDESFVLHQRCPQAVFSHDEALFYHGLTDREPMQQTLTIYSGYNTQKLKESGIKVFTVKKELLNVGKIIVENSYGHKIPVYDLERTICDLMRSRRYFEIQDFQTAIKTYVKRQDKDLNKLMTYAPLFRVEKRIRQYMEVLL